MSITQTLNTSIYRLSTQPIHPSQYEEALDSLYLIMTKYSSWKDPQSQDFITWGTEFQLGAAELNFEDLQCAEIAERISMHVQALFKLLSNPLDPNQLLRKPVLERTWVWEEIDLKTYQERFVPEYGTLSPLDKQPMEEAKAHLFAIEMIAWVHTYFITPGQLIHPEDVQPVSVFDSLSPVEIMMNMSSYAWTVENKTMRDALKELYETSCKLLQESAERHGENTRQFQQNLTSLKEETVQKIHDLNAGFEEKLKSEREAREKQEKDVHQLKSQVHDLRQNNQAQRAEIAGLHQQRVQYQKELKEIKKDSKKHKSSCTVM